MNFEYLLKLSLPWAAILQIGCSPISPLGSWNSYRTLRKESAANPSYQFEDKKVMYYDAYQDRLFLKGYGVLTRPDPFNSGHSQSTSILEVDFARAGRVAFCCSWRSSVYGIALLSPHRQSARVLAFRGIMDNEKTAAPMVNPSGLVFLEGSEWIGRRADSLKKVKAHQQERGSSPDTDRLLLADSVPGRPGFYFSPYTNEMVRDDSGFPWALAVDTSANPKKLVVLRNDFVSVDYADGRVRPPNYMERAGVKTDAEAKDYHARKGISSDPKSW